MLNHKNLYPFSNSNSKVAWYAVKVRGNYEKFVDLQLTKKGIKTSLPLISNFKQWSDRKKKIQTPLFKGYVFVFIKLSDQRLNVLQSDGVIEFVSFNKKTICIPKEQMYWLDRLFLLEKKINFEKEFPVGSNVEVVNGPLKGIQGKIKYNNSKSKLVIWIESIMQGVSLEIAPSLLLLKK